MSKVFIAWSGNFTVAKRLRELIDAHPGYEAIVGGNLHELNSAFVGGTIIDQMKSCDQGILLVQRNDLKGGLSANVMFEWGYLHAKLNAGKVHHFFINNPEIPSDLQGVWANTIDSTGKSDEEVAQFCYTKFFEAQRNRLGKNKMRVIIDKDETRTFINKHQSNPVCSNLEMAQYITLYCYTASIFIDNRREAFKDIEEFERRMDDTARQCRELSLSVKCARIVTEFLQTINYVDDDQFLKRRDFENIRDKFDDLYDEICSLEDNDDTDAKKLLLQCVDEFIAYMYLLIINNYNVEDEDRLAYCDDLIDYANAAIAVSDELEKESPSLNAQISRLIRSYVRSNMYHALVLKSELQTKFGIEYDEQERQKDITECLRLTLEDRRLLFNEYSVANVSATFLNNIEMEYYLALSEYIPFDTDPVNKKRSIDKVDRFIKKSEKAIAQRKVFIERMRELIAK